LIFYFYFLKKSYPRVDPNSYEPDGFRVKVRCKLISCIVQPKSPTWRLVNKKKNYLIFFGDAFWAEASCLIKKKKKTMPTPFSLLKQVIPHCLVCLANSFQVVFYIWCYLRQSNQRRLSSMIPSVPSFLQIYSKKQLSARGIKRKEESLWCG